jgi:hypothetical protein
LQKLSLLVIIAVEATSGLIRSTLLCGMDEESFRDEMKKRGMRWKTGASDAPRADTPWTDGCSQQRDCCIGRPLDRIDYTTAENDLRRANRKKRGSERKVSASALVGAEGCYSRGRQDATSQTK